MYTNSTAHMQIRTRLSLTNRFICFTIFFPHTSSSLFHSFILAFLLSFFVSLSLSSSSSHPPPSLFLWFLFPSFSLPIPLILSRLLLLRTSNFDYERFTIAALWKYCLFDRFPSVFLRFPFEYGSCAYRPCFHCTQADDTSSYQWDKYICHTE